MNEWLLKFGLGGVQEFIAHGRKTRDVAAGSRLVSAVSQAVANKAAEFQGSTRLLPVGSPTDETIGTKSASWPHQLVFWVEGKEQDVRAIGKGMMLAARDHWREALLGPVMNPPAEIRPALLTVDQSFLENQVDMALEAYWVAVPVLPAEGEDADKAFRRAFSALADLFDDRKHTRTFGQLQVPKQDGGTWTCLLCGARAAVVSKAGIAHLEPRGKEKLTGRDRLCTVCLGKRLWSYAVLSDEFPSTVRLGRAHLLRGETFEELKEALQQSGFTGEISRDGVSKIFDEWADCEDAEEMTEQSRTGGTRQDLFVHLQALLANDKRFRTRGYYCLALLDGDEMGKWFSGDRFQDGCDLRAAQDALGNALAAFVGELRRWFEDPARRPARLIYAGGDDGFVLLPLDDLVGFLQIVKSAWKQQVASDAVLQRFLPSKGAPPRVSLNACIAHEKEPLQPLVAGLQADLEEAKECGGRDVFSIRVHLRAGSSSQMIARWKDLDRFAGALGAFQLGPSSLPHDLMRAAEPFLATDGQEAWDALQRCLVGRVDRAFGEERLADADPIRRWLEGRVNPRDWPPWAIKEPYTNLERAEVLGSSLAVAAALLRLLRGEGAG
jgi:CRISPR-associated protein Cmr2